MALQGLGLNVETETILWASVFTSGHSGVQSPICTYVRCLSNRSNKKIPLIGD